MQAPRAVRIAGAVALVTTSHLLSAQVPAGAATITVTTVEDESNADGDCSLREAVEAANTDAAVDACAAGSGADVITLPSGTFVLTSQLVASDGAGLSLVGVGATASTISGSGGHRLLDVESGAISVDSLTMTGGEAGAEPGGAIRSDEDGVTVVDARLVDNTAAHGGAIEAIGGFVNVTRSAFIDNRGASNELNGNGGAIRTASGFVNVDESTFEGNTVANVGGAIVTSEGRVSVLRSTFTGNEGRAGGAIYNSFGLITIQNSTLHANTTTDINDFIGGAVETSTAGGGIHLLHVTITDNLVGHGVKGATADGANLIITGSIITGNAAGECDFSGEEVTSAGGNLVGDGSCNVLDATDEVVDDPGLGPLADNGGATFTRLPQAGSPAIDSATEGSCPEADQRRVVRPQDGDADGVVGCDRGAVELAAVPEEPTPEVPVTPGTPSPSAQPVTAQPTFTG